MSPRIIHIPLPHAARPRRSLVCPLLKLVLSISKSSRENCIAAGFGIIVLVRLTAHTSLAYGRGVNLLLTFSRRSFVAERITGSTKMPATTLWDELTRSEQRLLIRLFGCGSLRNQDPKAIERLHQLSHHLRSQISPTCASARLRDDAREVHRSRTKLRSVCEAFIPRGERPEYPARA